MKKIIIIRSFDDDDGDYEVTIDGKIISYDGYDWMISGTTPSFNCGGRIRFELPPPAPQEELIVIDGVIISIK